MSRWSSGWRRGIQSTWTKWSRQTILERTKEVGFKGRKKRRKSRSKCLVQWVSRLSKTCFQRSMRVSTRLNRKKLSARRRWTRCRSTTKWKTRKGDGGHTSPSQRARRSEEIRSQSRLWNSSKRWKRASPKRSSGKMWVSQVSQRREADLGKKILLRVRIEGEIQKDQSRNRRS